VTATFRPSVGLQSPSLSIKQVRKGGRGERRREFAREVALTNKCGRRQRHGTTYPRGRVITLGFPVPLLGARSHVPTTHERRAIPDTNACVPPTLDCRRRSRSPTACR